MYTDNQKRQIIRNGTQEKMKYNWQYIALIYLLMQEIYMYILWCDMH